MVEMGVLGKATARLVASDDSGLQVVYEGTKYTASAQRPDKSRPDGRATSLPGRCEIRKDWMGTTGVGDCSEMAFGSSTN